MRRDAGPAGDYTFQPSREAVRAFRDLPAELKLEWLEQAIRFVEVFVSPEKRARWDQRWQGYPDPVTHGPGNDQR
jgi:hypothetical protein